MTEVPFDLVYREIFAPYEHLTRSCATRCSASPTSARSARTRG
ncbi:hypothetical protein ACFQX7_31230 [Luedemannella flava]